MRDKFLLAIIAMISASIYGLRSPILRRASILRPMLASTLTTSIKDRQFEHHPAYRKIDEFFVQEYGIKGAMFEHQKSGAQVLSIIAPDDNKVFGINFRTPPSDSSGLPHILEHSVLCGSRKFPVKEPFVDMLKGSLQNFLNAFTYPDRTCYPIASVNTKDFYNLVHIYLDAVLHPRALHDPQVLQQEGWHYELQHPSDELTIKGVVYNEMKGVYSSPEALLARATEQALFPDTTYGLDSGGDPARIPDLTFAQFQAFHQKYYHPSNSRIFFYGDDDPLQRLELLDEYLRDFSRIPIDSSIPFQRKRQHLLEKVSVPYPVTPGRPPTHITTVNWLLHDLPLTPLEQLTLSVLNHLLLGTTTSVLYKALVESQLGESVTGGGLSSELLQPTFHVGLKGVQPEHTAQVESLILDTLQSVSLQGFDASAIEASINTLEFALREFNTGDYPRGLSVMLAMLSQWNYDRPPVDGLRFEQPLAELKQAIQQGRPVFQEAIQRLLLKNTHRVTVEMVPDLHLEEHAQQEETRRLADLKARFSPTQIEEIIQSTQALREAQERPDSPEARASLPKLSLDDIPARTADLPLTVESDGLHGTPCTVLSHTLPTSGILYAQVLLDFSHVSLEDIPYLPLFVRMLKEAGTEKRDATALAREIGIHTGGISLGLMQEHKAVECVAEAHEAMLYLSLQGKAVYDTVPHLFALFREILLTAQLNNPSRAIELLREMKARKEASLLTSGHSFAAMRLAAQHGGLVGHLQEQMYGLTSARQAAQLLEHAQENWHDLHQRLENIRQTILRKTPRKNTRSFVVNLTGEEAGLAIARREMEALVGALSEGEVGEGGGDRPTAPPTLQATWRSQSSQWVLPARDEAFAIPSLVNMVVQAGPMYHPGEKLPGSSSVVTRYLSTGYLWDTVRVVGGAYGGSARLSPATGRLVFQSYRDPNLLETLQAYQQSVDYLEEHAKEMDEERLGQAVIGTIGDLDSPMSVDQKGHVSMMRFLHGWTADLRQVWREQVLRTSKKDVHEYIQRMRHVAKDGRVVAFGSQQAIEKANRELPEGKKLHMETALQNLQGGEGEGEGEEGEVREQ